MRHGPGVVRRPTPFLFFFSCPDSTAVEPCAKVVAITPVNYNFEHVITLLGFEFLEKTFTEAYMKSGAGY